ncbi:MAG: fumarylacetoacetate hydrolase family protein [Rubricoccaceae bacterium]
MHLPIPGVGDAVRPGKILCIGRNYAEHVREMGDVAGLPAEPVVFLKPSTALVADGGEVVLPRQSSEVHHELEIVAAIGRGGRDIAEADALRHVAGYALGLDLTARDLQARAKEARGPWSIAKGFDTFAPVGPFVPARAVPDVQAVELSLFVNGERRQHGSSAQMLFPVARLVAYLSSVFTLEPGDLVFTGTPEGVGPVRDGDRLEAVSPALPPLRVSARAAR